MGARRIPLSRARVVAAAIALTDEQGIDQLSMRRLARALDVEAMSLYHHVANKDDLLDAMVDAVYDEIEIPPTDDWRAAMRGRGHSARAVLGRHPWAVALLESRRTPGDANLRHHDAVLGVLRRGGFSVVGAAHAYSAIDAYLFGFVLQEATFAVDLSSPDEIADVTASIVADDGAARYPHLAEMIAEVATRPGYTYGAEFDFGLDLLLDALDRIRPTA